MRKVIMALILSASAAVFSQKIIVEEPLRFLALGDSYTIGESVQERDRWPVQLVNRMKRDYGVKDAEVDIIAQTGWTTTVLKNAIAALLDTTKEYNLVSLLIGVNNQYQGVEFSVYETEFVELMETALSIVDGDHRRVFVVSIPDYAYTPSFRNDERVSRELDIYNDYNEKIAKQYGVAYIYITPISRNGLEDPELVADDRLHPSGKQYTEWVKAILAQMEIILQETVSLKDNANDTLSWTLSSEYLSVDLPGSGGLLTMHDISGRRLFAAVQRGEQYKTPVTNLPTGVYFINYQYEEKKFSGKVLIN